MNDDIDFEMAIDCANALKALGDIMMASKPDVELYPGTVQQLGIMIFKTVNKLEKALKINKTPSLL